MRENNETPDACFCNERTVASDTIIFTMKNIHFQMWFARSKVLNPCFLLKNIRY